jgi:hypothetical protein
VIIAQFAVEIEVIHQLAILALKENSIMALMRIVKHALNSV